MNACKWHMKTKIISKTNHPERVVWQIKRGFYTKWWIFFFASQSMQNLSLINFMCRITNAVVCFIAVFHLFFFSIHTRSSLPSSSSSPDVFAIFTCFVNQMMWHQPGKKMHCAKKNREYSSKDENQMLLERFECAHRPFINFLQASAIWLHAQFTFACSYL